MRGDRDNAPPAGWVPLRDSGAVGTFTRVAGCLMPGVGARIWEHAFPMNKRLAFAAAAILSLSVAPALAQTSKAAADPAAPPSTSATPPADEPADTSASTSTAAPSTSATGAASASSAGADVSVKSGMSVKDNTGATIGQISEVKTGADGKKTATIKMGADTFAVDTSSLAVASGAATVNATQAEIKGMLKKK